MPLWPWLSKVVDTDACLCGQFKEIAKGRDIVTSAREKSLHQM